MYRGGAKRCSLKHSSRIILARLIAPLAMREENRQRRQYRKELKRYERYVREQQRVQEQNRSARLPRDTQAGAADGASLRGGTSCWIGRLARRLRRLGGKLKPRTMFRAGREDTTTPVERPRCMPHWHGTRPKPTPYYMTTGTPCPRARPLGYRARARGRAAMRRDAPSLYRPQEATSQEAKKILAAHEAEAGKTCVINKEDMPKRYRRAYAY